MYKFWLLFVSASIKFIHNIQVHLSITLNSIIWEQIIQDFFFLLNMKISLALMEQWYTFAGMHILPLQLSVMPKSTYSSDVGIIMM